MYMYMYVCVCIFILTLYMYIYICLSRVADEGGVAGGTIDSAGANAGGNYV